MLNLAACNNQAPAATYVTTAGKAASLMRPASIVWWSVDMLSETYSLIVQGHLWWNMIYLRYPLYNCCYITLAACYKNTQQSELLPGGFLQIQRGNTWLFPFFAPFTRILIIFLRPQKKKVCLRHPCALLCELHLAHLFFIFNITKYINIEPCLRHTFFFCGLI